jgi:hypothetical protein
VRHPSWRSCHDVEALAPPTCVYASTSTSIPVARLAESAARPEEIRMRSALALVDEASFCLGEGVLRSRKLMLGAGRLLACVLA